MKRFISIILVLAIVFSFSACGNGEVSNNQANDNIEKNIETKPQKIEEEIIEDEAWDELNALGSVKTENGILTVSLTIPADFVGEDITQEKLDESKDDAFLSAKLNDDGSVTYKMTKKQHKAMLDDMVTDMEAGLKEMVDSRDYSFTEITHNKNYTEFNVKLDKNELSLIDSFATLAFYMYGGFYGIFAGSTPKSVVVNYYDMNGKLIQSADSANMK